MTPLWIAGILRGEFIGGIHTALERLHAFQIPPFENGYDGTPFHEFLGRLHEDRWPLPERPRE